MTSIEDPPTSIIGILNEKPLHAALKTWYAQENDKFEVDVDGYVVDILRDDLVIEIQTRSFSKIRRKLTALCAHRPVRLIYPIPSEKWIIKIGKDGNRQLSRRKSPKRGTYEDLFTELVSFPHLMKSPDFSLEVLITKEEEFRRHDPQRAWRRRGWVTQERHLIEVVDQRRFNRPEDFAVLIPASVQDEFTTSDLASALQKPSRLAGQMAYCLREMDAIVPVGKRGRAIRYKRR